MRAPDKKTIGRIGGALCALTLVLVSYTQCLVEQKTNAPRQRVPNAEQNQQSSSESEQYRWEDYAYDEVEETTMPPMFEQDERIREERVYVGIKNFEQINQTMSAVTGVPITIRDVERVYRDVASQLPSDNDIKSFAANNQVAITKLASEYCDYAVRQSSIRSQIWPNINFGQSPNQSLTTERQNYLVERTMEQFWGSGVLDRNQELVSGLELRTLIIDLLQGAPQNSSSTQMVVKGVCIATLASIHMQLL